MFFFFGRRKQVSGFGSLVAQVAQLSGSGLAAGLMPTGTGNLVAQIATLSGTADAEVPAYTGTGTLTAQVATLSGSGSFADFIASGNLIAQIATLSGAGISYVPAAGSDNLIAQIATLTGVALMTPPDLFPFPRMGGLAITDAYWTGQRALSVDFLTTYSKCLYQLYAGRTLIGATKRITQRTITGQLQPSKIPAPLIVLAVLPDQVTTDYGAFLPPRPWNKYRLAWSESGSPSDSRWFDLTGSAVAGGSIDDSNILSRVPIVGDGDYSFDLPTLTGGGIWQYKITPRDDALPRGNPGTPATISINALCYPPDVRGAGQARFTVSVAAGVATVRLAYDW